MCRAQLLSRENRNLTRLLLQIYRRTVQNSADPEPSIARIREEICSAVEAEIQNEVVEYEISDEEYVEVSNAAWSRMYSVALQYHQSGLKPMGLMVDAVGRSGKISVIFTQLAKIC